MKPIKWTVTKFTTLLTMLVMLLTASLAKAQNDSPCENPTAECVTAEKRKDCAKAVRAIPDLKTEIFDLKKERDQLTGKFNSCQSNLKDCQLSLKNADREVGQESAGLDTDDLALFSATFGSAGAAGSCYVAKCEGLEWSAVPVSAIVSWGTSKIFGEILF